jgi:hypothetical protein
MSVTRRFYVANGCAGDCVEGRWVDVEERWATLVSSRKKDLSHECMGVHQINPQVYQKRIVLDKAKTVCFGFACKNKSKMALSKTVHFTLFNGSY